MMSNNTQPDNSFPTKNQDKAESKIEILQINISSLNNKILELYELLINDIEVDIMIITTYTGNETDTKL